VKRKNRGGRAGVNGRLQGRELDGFIGARWNTTQESESDSPDSWGRGIHPKVKVGVVVTPGETWASGGDWTWLATVGKKKTEPASGRGSWKKRELELQNKRKGVPLTTKLTKSCWARRQGPSKGRKK